MELFLVEASGLIDPKTFEYDDKDLWLYESGSYYCSASTLQQLHSLGCRISGTSPLDGWNCLFVSVMDSENPSNSRDFEKIQFLLSVFDDVYARDRKGATVFDWVNEDVNGLHSPGSYRRDLWYCALERVGIDISDHLAHHPRIGVYNKTEYCCYTPEHYRALKRLQSWDQSNFRSQMDNLLQENPLDEEESREMERIRELGFEPEEDESW
jgi:hypothetical protein